MSGTWASLPCGTLWVWDYSRVAGWAMACRKMSSFLGGGPAWSEISIKKFSLLGQLTKRAQLPCP